MLTQNEDQKVEEKGRKGEGEKGRRGEGEKGRRGEREKGRSAWQLAVYK